VVFLHGTSGHLEAFSRNIGPHVRAGFRCHAIDMLGHGYTGKPDVDYEIPLYAAHVADYLDACGIEAAHIVGESLGGWVGARLAIDQPERVRSLQLVASGGTKANPEVMERIKVSTRKAVENDDRALTRSRLELLMFDPVNVDDELVEIRHRIYQQPSFRQAVGHLLCLQEWDIRQRNLLRPDDLARIAAPTLVVWGHENPFGDVPEAAAMHEAIAGSRLVLYPECGHWPQHEHADAYNELSIGFLQEHA
jgi:2-hydroxy-6-oxonona-2,4-dienedioate hydrolase